MPKTDLGLVLLRWSNGVEPIGGRWRDAGLASPPRRGSMNFLRGLRNPPGMTAKAAKEISGDCSAPQGPELQDQVHRERPGGARNGGGGG